MFRFTNECRALTSFQVPKLKAFTAGNIHNKIKSEKDR